MAGSTATLGRTRGRKHLRKSLTSVDFFMCAPGKDTHGEPLLPYAPHGFGAFPRGHGAGRLVPWGASVVDQGASWCVVSHNVPWWSMLCQGFEEEVLEKIRPIIIDIPGIFIRKDTHRQRRPFTLQPSFPMKVKQHNLRIDTTRANKSSVLSLLPVISLLIVL